MGWSACGVDGLGRPIGYGVEEALSPMLNPAVTCDFEDCEEEINRGIDCACGGMHGEGDDAGIHGEPCCERYFCGDHSDPLDHKCPYLKEHQDWEWKEELKDSVKDLVRVLEKSPRDSGLFRIAHAAAYTITKTRDARDLKDAKAAAQTPLGKKQYDRGFSDGKAGHSPSILGGPYLLGYRAGGGRW